MILVDTCVWVDHLRAGDDELKTLLRRGQVLCHPLVIGELACGNLANRTEILDLLSGLPEASQADQDEALLALERHRLMGRGLGYVDVLLLVSALLTPDTQLWTRDRRLATAATELGIGWKTMPTIHDVRHQR